MNEEDQDIFSALEDFLVEDIDGSERQGYRISMKFKANNFFNNSTLTKEYIVNNEGQLTSNITEIKWKETKEAKKRADREHSFFSTLFKNLGEGEDEVAEIVHEDLWPNAVKYFQGLVDQDDDEFAEEDDDDDEAEEGEGEEGEPEEE